MEPSWPCVRVVFTCASGPPPELLPPLEPPPLDPPPLDPPPPLEPPPLDPELPPDPCEPPLEGGVEEVEDVDGGELLGDVGMDTVAGMPAQALSASAHGTSQASLVLGVRVIVPILPRPDRPRPGVSTLSLI